MLQRLLVSITMLSIVIGAVWAQVRRDDADNPVTEFVAQIEAGDYGDVHSLLISQHGDLVVEYYFNDTTGAEQRLIYSVTKSVTSAGIGLAIADGYIDDVETPISAYFPDHDLTSEQQNITLEHLLTMSAGFEWNELSEPYTSVMNDANRIANQRDPYGYVLRREQVSDSGEQFLYNSGISIMLGEVLHHLTEQPAEDYIGDNLLSRIGIDEWRWTNISGDISNTGWGLVLRPLDLMTFGELYLNEGRHDGEQIISAEWVRESTRAHIRVDEFLDYGYQWWRFSNDYLEDADIDLTDVYFAWGYGGQFVIIAPEVDLVVVSTSGNYNGDSGEMLFTIADIVLRYYAQ